MGRLGRTRQANRRAKSPNSTEYLYLAKSLASRTSKRQRAVFLEPLALHNKSPLGREGNWGLTEVGKHSCRSFPLRIGWSAGKEQAAGQYSTRSGTPVALARKNERYLDTYVRPNAPARRYVPKGLDPALVGEA